MLLDGVQGAPASLLVVHPQCGKRFNVPLRKSVGGFTVRAFKRLVPILRVHVPMDARSDRTADLLYSGFTEVFFGHGPVSPQDDRIVSLFPPGVDQFAGEHARTPEAWGSGQ